MTCELLTLIEIIIWLTIGILIGMGIGLVYHIFYMNSKGY